jgi:hypothetical protein
MRVHDDPSLEHRVWPWLAAAVAVALQSATHLANELLLGGRYHALDAAVDGSVFGRANSVVIGVSAALVALAAWRRKPTRASRLLLCACLLLVMADDATGLHDRLATFGAGEALLGLALACVLAVTGWLLLREAALARRVPRLLIFVGLAALALAVGVRLVAAASAVGAGLDTTTRALGVAGEQGLDFGGWVLVAAGLFVLVGPRRETRAG